VLVEGGKSKNRQGGKKKNTIICQLSDVGGRREGGGREGSPMRRKIVKSSTQKELSREIEEEEHAEVRRGGKIRAGTKRVLFRGGKVQKRQFFYKRKSLS